MKLAAVDTATPFAIRSPRRSAGSITLAAVGCCALLLGACGGGDDDDGADGGSTTTTTSPATSIAPITSPATTTTTPPTTTTLPPLVLVTEGATVVVANASGVDGSAGRLTDKLSAVGFATGSATNSSEGQLNITKIYYDPANESAQAIANSVRDALGGGDIEVLELVIPAPTDTGEIGDASILVAMGNDTADKSLDELQGRVPPAGDEDSADASSSEESSSEASSDESSSDG